jgi:membrane fusion protein (multidrug efflux system)
MGSGALESAAPGDARVTLILEDGTVYAHSGKLLFSDIAVDPTTGMITLRAEFSNRENLLMPGMFARAQIIEGVNTNAITVPQRTITRGAGGASSVLVVTDQNKVEARTIETDGTVGNKVIVVNGLKAGERIMVEGSQKAPPGSVVKPVPFNPPSPTGTQPKAN